MASSFPVCGICALQHFNKPAAIWCSECDEELCNECQKHHSLSKGTRRHFTMSINEHMSLHEKNLQAREYCHKHSKRYQLFCIQHDCPCCKLCAVEEHSNCKNVTAIERVIKNVKTSNKFQEAEHLIAEILETIGKIQVNRSNHLSSIRQQRQSLQKEILAIRRKINTHLDQAQETLMNELSLLESRIQKQTSEVLTSLNLEKSQLIDYLTTISGIKQHATDLQTFLSIHEIEREVSNIDKSLHILLKNDEMKNLTLLYKIDSKVQYFPKAVSTFGQIIVKSHPCELAISRRKSKEAQSMVIVTPSRSIENITLKLQQTINTQLKYTTGCVLLPDDRMVFSCNNQSCIKSINKEGLQDLDTGELSPPTFDITYIENTNTIAVTSGYGPPCIRIIDIGNGHVNKTFRVKSFCYGIAYKKNTLVYCVRDKGLRMINLNDESESVASVEQMSVLSYVVTYRDKLYFTSKDTHTVTCCDLHGNTHWQFKDESILKYPLGITVDNDGNIYVVGLWTKNVVVISSNGQHRRQLLGPEDGLDGPQVLHFNRFTNRLLVANAKDVAFLFLVSS